MEKKGTNCLGGCKRNNKSGDIWVWLWKMTESPQNAGQEKQYMVNKSDSHKYQTLTYIQSQNLLFIWSSNLKFVWLFTNE